MKKKSSVTAVVFVLIIIMCELTYAENAKPEGLEVAPNTVVAVLRKLGAFFTGNLEWTMSPDKKIKKEDYTIDPLGREVPRSTLKENKLE